MTTYPHVQTTIASDTHVLCRCGARHSHDTTAPPLTWGADCPVALMEAIAELEATIANERGEGEPPAPGWTWALEGEIADPCWHRGGAVVYMERDYEPALPGHFWLWWAPGMRGCKRAKTAREGMRAATLR